MERHKELTESLPGILNGAAENGDGYYRHAVQDRNGQVKPLPSLTSEFERVLKPHVSSSKELLLTVLYATGNYVYSGIGNTLSGSCV